MNTNTTLEANPSSHAPKNDSAALPDSTWAENRPASAETASCCTSATPSANAWIPDWVI